jgi:hypothetical protein
MNVIKIIFKLIFAIMILYYIWCIFVIYPRLSESEKNYKCNAAIKIMILATALVIDGI